MVPNKVLNRNYVQVIERGGIIETTVDHSDIRGLVTACHVYTVELPLSKGGSLAVWRIP